VAGTNGKGSVVAFMRAMAEAAGLKVHVYTSPHLIRFNERIRLAGELISDDMLLELLEECEAANGDDPITFFEMTTALAFLAFARTTADLVLLETGLGGRLDATNVVKRPAATALTSISIDHVGFLGDDIRGIAAEKADIMRKDVVCVSSAQTLEVTEVIRDKADAHGAKLWMAGDDWSFQTMTEGVRIITPKRDHVFEPPALPGWFQQGNAAQAAATLDAVLGFSFENEEIQAGMAGVEWPGRLVRLTEGPLVDSLPEGWELWLDGGHNPGAAEVIADEIKTWTDKALYLVVGMINTKDAGGYLNPLARHIDGLTAVSIAGEDAALPAEDVADAAKRTGIAAETAEDFGAAVKAIAGRPPRPGRILICGSLYLAGQVLQTHG